MRFVDSRQSFIDGYATAGMSDREATEDDESWGVSLSDIEQREAAEAAAAADTENSLEAGDPTLEGAVFVLLGVAFAVFVISRLFLG
jgi:hypothetical protein